MSDHASTGRTAWMSWAACVHADPELFFPAATGITGAGQAQAAKEVCASCPVRLACLAYALVTRQKHGIWGGATDKERRAMARSGRRIASSPRWDGTAAGLRPSRPSASQQAGRCLTVTVPATGPGQRPAPDLTPAAGLRAEPGDTLVIDGTGMSGLPRTGTIIAVAGQDGRPPYLVRWTGGDYESRISPCPGARVEEHHG